MVRINPYPICLRAFDSSRAGCWRLCGQNLPSLTCGGAIGQIGSSTFVPVAQSSDGSPASGARNALDTNNATFSLTADLPGSYWTAELGRPYSLTRVELVNRTAPADQEMNGLTLRLFNLDDQIVFQTGLTNPGSGGTRIVNLPAGLRARTLWIGLLGTQTNGGGFRRVGLAEVRMFGDVTMPYGPDPYAAPTNVVRV